MCYYFFHGQKLLLKAKDRYHSYGGKKTLLNIILKINKF